jgi:hypothetical protein
VGKTVRRNQTMSKSYTMQRRQSTNHSPAQMQCKFNSKTK